MKIQETRLNDCIIIHPQVFGDDRGSFTEVFDEQYADIIYPSGLEFVQDNISISKKGVFRGLHIQLGEKQGKLVTCMYGLVTDFVVDLRPCSPTYKHWASEKLSGNTKDQIYIPPGFAHGFYAHKEDSIVHYKTSELYNKPQERTLFWRDKDIDINYIYNGVFNVLLSDKDEKGLSFRELEKEL